MRLCAPCVHCWAACCSRLPTSLALYNSVSSLADQMLSDAELGGFVEFGSDPDAVLAAQRRQRDQARAAAAASAAGSSAGADAEAAEEEAAEAGDGKRSRRGRGAARPREQQIPEELLPKVAIVGRPNVGKSGEPQAKRPGPRTPMPMPNDPSSSAADCTLPQPSCSCLPTCPPSRGCCVPVAPPSTRHTSLASRSPHCPAPPAALFNRIVGAAVAIVYDYPGVTRDRSAPGCTGRYCQQCRQPCSRPCSRLLPALCAAPLTPT